MRPDLRSRQPANGQTDRTSADPPHAQVWRVSAYAESEVATMKLSIASRGGVVSDEEAEAREFAQMIEDQAQDDDWIRVLYAVQAPDTAEIEQLTFRVEREPTKKTG